jgi:hypothetical protein
MELSKSIEIPVLCDTVISSEPHVKTMQVFLILFQFHPLVNHRPPPPVDASVLDDRDSYLS